jgi:hypothetical protein
MRKEEHVIKEKLQKLIERMKKLGYKDFKIRRLKRMVNELQRNNVYGVDKFVQKLLDRVNDKEGYLDILIEGRFAVVLARNNFSRIQIEFAPRGPDLRAVWNRNIVYFEVTRKRSIEDEWAKPLEDPKLPSNKTETILEKIRSKSKQLEAGEINIVVFWSSTLAVLELEMKETFDKIDNDPRQYKDLSGILFTEDAGVSIPTLEQFYLFKNDKASKLLGTRLTKKLKSLHEQDIKRFQKGHQSIFAMLMQP